MRRWVSLGAVVVAACGRGSRGVAPIRLDPLVTLGDSAGPGAMLNAPRISALHPAGFRVVIPASADGGVVPLVYDRHGAFIGTLAAPVGADGFERPRFVRIGPGDSLWVFDAGKRVLVFGPDRRFVRTVMLPVEPWDGLVLPDGRLVVRSVFVAESLVVLDASGSAERRLSQADTSSGLSRLIPAPGKGLWSLAMQSRWQVEHWDSLGGAPRILQRTPSWYPPYQSFHGPTRDAPPSPTLIDGWFDSQGRLWVVGQAADPHWQKGLGGTDAGVTIADADRVYDTVIEVLDPVTLKVLAEARFDVWYALVAEPGVLGRIIDLPSGHKRVMLMAVVLDSTRVVSPR